MIETTLFILLFGVLIYFWNLYVIPIMIARVVLVNPTNHWLKTNQDMIVRGFQGFFWTAYILIAYNNLFAY